MWMNLKKHCAEHEKLFTKRYVLYVSILYKILEQASLIYGERNQSGGEGIGGKFLM